MRILCHVPWEVNNDVIGGTEYYAINLCEGFKELGHDVTMVCTSFVDEVNVKGIPVYGRMPPEYADAARKRGINEFFFRDVVLKGNIKNYHDYILFVEKQIEGLEYDLLVLNGFMYSLVDQKKFPPEKTIAINHDNPEEFDNYWGKGAYEWFLKEVHRPKINTNLQKIKLFVESQHYANIYSRDWGIECHAIPSGVDVAGYDELPPRDPLRKENDVEGKLVFLLPCRLEYKQKGQDIAIKALGMLKDELPPFKLIFSGYEPAYAESKKFLEGLAEENGVLDNLLIKSYNDIREGYSVADVVLLPERFASYGFSLMQSVTLGLPTVASNIPSYTEIASKVPFVELVGLTPEAFAKAIKKMVSCDLARNVGFGKAFAEHNTWVAASKRYLGVFNSD